MEYRSLAMSFRIQLGFHAANNEGSGGTNVMEPRRITVGDKEYDGISGEIIRHHILENFVKLCRHNGVKLHARCEGLVPDRGKDPLKQWMRNNNSSLPKKKVQEKELPFLDPSNYPKATRKLIEECALCDIGGYLIALEASDNAQGTLKRDSCFEVGWLITEHPAIVDFTQHAAYFHTPEKPEEHNLFVQNMRTGIYGGVLRIDLDRIGFNDWWWLEKENNAKLQRPIDDNERKQPQGSDQGQEQEQTPINDNDRKKRIKLLLMAVHQWLMSPSFAKQTGWLQHMSGLLEGAIALSKDGPAPFYSPIQFEANPHPIIKPNPKYRDLLERVKSKTNNTLEVHRFDSPDQFEEKMKEIEDKLSSQGGKSNAAQKEEKPAHS